MERLWESARCELELERGEARGMSGMCCSSFHVDTWCSSPKTPMSRSAAANPLMSASGYNLKSEEEGKCFSIQLVTEMGFSCGPGLNF
ncbi:hypothetical protein KOW79_003870 [Hemibagrus wyckioides]|uniref:Uncharacterized protein n=1 Tax=Hemibagrus wyckioides TaxID=337641 RepID=A0A9D3NZR9_9TELE|nr:hypothetical protein KOW79_003870 [Hemibagrus wyckioides]